MKELYKNREWLNEKYWIDELSTAKIGETCNVTRSNIDWWMHKFNISFRQPGEGVRGKKNKMFGKKGKDHPAFGYRHTKEARIRISENKKKGKYIFCKTCGKPKYVNQSKLKEGPNQTKYCSMKCQQKGRHRRVSVICKDCGNLLEITKYAYHKSKSKTFICSKCMQFHRIDIKIICQECGRIKLVSYCKRNMKYCSMPCARKAIGKAKRGENNPGWKPKVKKTCPECGIIFPVCPSQQERKYCSIPCSNKSKKKRYKGKNNHFYGKNHSKVTRKMMSNLKKKLYADSCPHLLKALQKRPTKLEKTFDEMTPDCVQYVGNRAWWRRLPNGKNKNPDFKIKNQRKIIEVFGGKGFFHTDKEARELVSLYNQIGYNCLIIWEQEIYQQPEKVIKKVSEFIDTLDQENHQQLAC